MKITYLNSFYAPEEVGGAEKSVRFLAEQMVARGHDVSVICLGRTAERTELNGVKIYRVPVHNLYHPSDAGQKASWQKMVWHGLDSYNPMAAKALGQLLEQIKPDVVHTNTLAGWSVAVWGEIKARGIRLVHSLRDYYLLCPNTAMFRNGAQCKKRCTDCSCMAVPRKAPTQHVDLVLGNSRFILEKHQSFGLFEGVSSGVIYNAYEPQKINRKDSCSDRVKFGYIGRLAPTKGVETLISATRYLHQTNNAFEVLIAGEGDSAYVQALQNQCEGLPVKFLGKVEPGPFYDQIDWTVIPSVWDEPLARVLFESFCHGVPVIGTTTGGTPELIEHGKDGFLFPPSRVDVLQNLMDQSVRNHKDWKTFAMYAREKSPMFNPGAVCDRFLKAYEGAVIAS